MGSGGITLSLIVTCKGRLAQARVSVPAALSVLGPGDELVFVDYDCPDHAADLMRALFIPRCTVVRIRDCPSFHANHARNLGLRVAVCDVCVFADIDFSVTAALVAECRACRSDEFLLQHDEVHSLGFLAAWRSVFLDVQGWEEAFTGYGEEDTFQRQVLMARGLRPTLMVSRLVPLSLGPHPRFYEDPNLAVGIYTNRRMVEILRMRHAWKQNVNRNWGHGGILVLESEARIGARESGPPLPA
jgi:hypothetical protein